MHFFQLKYHKSSVLIAALFGVPTIGAILMLFILFELPTHTPVWIITLLICAFLALMTIALKWLFKSQIFVSCKVNIDKKGIKFYIQNPGLFYDKKQIIFNWDKVDSIVEKFNGQSGNYFYEVTFLKPYFKANFSIEENYEEEAEHFFKELLHFQDLYDL